MPIQYTNITRNIIEFMLCPRCVFTMNGHIIIVIKTKCFIAGIVRINWHRLICLTDTYCESSYVYDENASITRCVLHCTYMGRVFYLYVYMCCCWDSLLLASNKYLHMFCGVIIYVYFVCSLFVILDIDCWLNGCALILNSLDL